MTDAVKELLIKASPVTIYPFLTDSAQFVRWMGTDASIVATSGGEFRAL